MFKNTEKGQALLWGLRDSRGQALLIVVLVMVVALTVGLSIASRTIINLKTSTEEANSQKALSAAEAGIEQAIKSNQIGINVANGTFTDTKASYQTSVTAVSGTSFLINGGNPVLQDNGADLWLSNYSSDPNQIFSNPWTGTLTVAWGNSSDPCSNSALEIIIISGATKQSATSKRYVFDACSSRGSSNHFTQVSLSQTTILGKTFYFQSTPISVSSGFLGRIIPLYFNTVIGTTGNVALPSQGTIITSTGTLGPTTRKVNVYQGYPEIPSEYFPYNLFSP